VIKIGSASIETNIFLAPLAGVADLSFRLIAREHGAEFAFFEMTDTNCLVRGQGKNKDLMMVHPDDRPIAAQLLGNNPADVLKAAQMLIPTTDPVFVDLNAACPVNKVQRKKSGAYLISEPEKLYAIIDKLAHGIDRPVTVKLRVGYNDVDLEGIAKLAKRCEESGAAALFVHGRTRKQLYHGDVNYAAIKAMKEAVKIPLFGSGNVLSPQLAKKMFDETGCDGILVARGALGHPWIFRQIKAYLKDGTILPDPDWEEKKRILLKHLSYIQKYRLSRLTNKLGLMRKICHFYIKAHRNVAQVRKLITNTKSYLEFVEIVSKL
jgi:tRNA-dihydrouridine synthase B